MKGNTDKSHLLMTNARSLEIHEGESIIKCSDCEKPLEIKINSKLHFRWSCKNDLFKEGNKPLINSFLMHNSITGYWFGCFTAVRMTKH